MPPRKKKGPVGPAVMSPYEAEPVLSALQTSALAKFNDFASKVPPPPGALPSAPVSRPPMTPLVPEPSASSLDELLVRGAVGSRNGTVPSDPFLPALARQAKYMLTNPVRQIGDIGRGAVNAVAQTASGAERMMRVAQNPALMGLELGPAAPKTAVQRGMDYVNEGLAADSPISGLFFSNPTESPEAAASSGAGNIVGQIAAMVAGLGGANKALAASEALPTALRGPGLAARIGRSAVTSTPVTMAQTAGDPTADGSGSLSQLIAEQSGAAPLSMPARIAGDAGLDLLFGTAGEALVGGAKAAKASKTTPMPDVQPDAPLPKRTATPSPVETAPAPTAAPAPAEAAATETVAPAAPEAVAQRIEAAATRAEQAAARVEAAVAPAPAPAPAPAAPSIDRPALAKRARKAPNAFAPELVPVAPAPVVEAPAPAPAPKSANPLPKRSKKTVPPAEGVAPQAEAPVAAPAAPAAKSWDDMTGPEKAASLRKDAADARASGNAAEADAMEASARQYEAPPKAPTQVASKTPVDVIVPEAEARVADDVEFPSETPEPVVEAPVAKTKARRVKNAERIIEAPEAKHLTPDEAEVEALIEQELAALDTIAPAPVAKAAKPPKRVKPAPVAPTPKTAKAAVKKAMQATGPAAPAAQVEATVALTRLNAEEVKLAANEINKFVRTAAMTRSKEFDASTVMQKAVAFLRGRGVGASTLKAEKDTLSPSVMQSVSEGIAGSKAAFDELADAVMAGLPPEARTQVSKPVAVAGFLNAPSVRAALVRTGLSAALMASVPTLAEAQEIDGEDIEGMYDRDEPFPFTAVALGLAGVGLLGAAGRQVLRGRGGALGYLPKALGQVALKADLGETVAKRMSEIASSAKIAATTVADLGGPLTRSIEPRAVTTARPDPYNFRRFGMTPGSSELNQLQDMVGVLTTDATRTGRKTEETVAAAAKLIGLSPDELTTSAARGTIDDSNVVLAAAYKLRENMEVVNALEAHMNTLRAERAGLDMSSPLAVSRAGQLDAEIEEFAMSQVYHYDKGVQMAQIVYPQSTAQGRALRDNKIVATLLGSPTPWLRKASKVLGRELTTMEQADITRMVMQGPEARMALAEHLTEIQSNAPVMQQVAHILRMGYLTVPGRRIADVVSTAGNAVAETLTVPLQIAGDRFVGKLLALATGEPQNFSITAARLPYIGAKMLNKGAKAGDVMAFRGAMERSRDSLSAAAETLGFSAAAREFTAAPVGSSRFKAALNGFADEVQRANISEEQLQGLDLPNVIKIALFPEQMGRIGAMGNTFMNTMAAFIGRSTTAAERMGEAFMLDTMQRDVALRWFMNKGLRGDAAVAAARDMLKAGLPDELAIVAMEQMRQITLANGRSLSAMLVKSAAAMPGNAVRKLADITSKTELGIAKSMDDAAGGNRMMAIGQLGPAAAREIADGLDMTMNVLVAPFRTVPANIAARIADASPLGFASMIYHSVMAVNDVGRLRLNKNVLANFDDLVSAGKLMPQDKAAIEAAIQMRKNSLASRQGRIAQVGARATMGTAAAMAMGYKLAEQGVLVGPSSMDPQQRLNTESQGVPPGGNAILAFGEWRSLSGMQPLFAPLLLGAAYFEAVRDGGTAVDKSQAILSSIGKIMVDQPMFQTPNQLMQALGDKEKGSKFVQRVVSGAAVPALSNAIAGADGIRRNPEGIDEAITARLPDNYLIPGRSSIPARVNGLGDPLRQAAGVTNRVMNPLPGTKDQYGRRGVSGKSAWPFMEIDMAPGRTGPDDPIGRAFTQRAPVTADLEETKPVGVPQVRKDKNKKTGVSSNNWDLVMKAEIMGKATREALERYKKTGSAVDPNTREGRAVLSAAKRAGNASANAELELQRFRRGDRPTPKRRRVGPIPAR